MSLSQKVLDYDLKKTIHANRLVGLWRLMTGFRLNYLGANLSLGISALAKTKPVPTCCCAISLTTT